MATNFDLICTALITIEQWGFFSVPHLLWHETSVYTVISEDRWLSHLLSSVWRFRCHYLFYRITIVATGDQTPISCIKDQSSTNLATWRRKIQKKCNVMYYWILKETFIETSSYIQSISRNVIDNRKFFLNIKQTLLWS